MDVSSLDDAAAAALSLYRNMATPMTIIKINRNLAGGYRFRAKMIPSIITGMGLADFPNTCMYIIGYGYLTCTYIIIYGYLKLVMN